MRYDWELTKGLAIITDGQLGNQHMQDIKAVVECKGSERKIQCIYTSTKAARHVKIIQALFGPGTELGQ
ncbi:uncharacterized protein BO96DRAFT_436904 [Aspergillus niger CBS 101883]|uniref:Contig An12c0030, genomic contig n=2 Tax=Aspergillus niger TaxID=5061 RepID=A2QYE9_ASPNC|nr:uncharacterized protein BO96DRAFT_436904 [Aspergillus niger CBS 101883]XP_059601777.1 uncharacterized protein An12g00990 [Aspergillus niger]PYH53610.1 hypothetical protein BO96DRAFT_436904 [Aspergillus niger CBS 101883]CAK41029.1 unnamed protein product [Aspergillus niger]